MRPGKESSDDDKMGDKEFATSDRADLPGEYVAAYFAAQGVLEARGDKILNPGYVRRTVAGKIRGSDQDYIAVSSEKIDQSSGSSEEGRRTGEAVRFHGMNYGGVIIARYTDDNGETWQYWIQDNNDRVGSEDFSRVWSDLEKMEVVDFWPWGFP